MEDSGSPLVRPMIGHNVSRRLLAILALGMGLVHPACGRFGYDLSAASGDAGSGGTGLGGGTGGGGGISGSAGFGGASTGGGGGISGSGGSAGISGRAGTGGSAGISGSAGIGGGAGISGGAGAGGSAGISGSAGAGGSAGIAGAPGGAGAPRRGRRCSALRRRGHRGRGRAGRRRLHAGDVRRARLRLLPRTAHLDGSPQRLRREGDATRARRRHGGEQLAGVGRVRGGASSSAEYWSWLGASDLALVGEWRWTDGALFWLGGSNGSAQSGLYANWLNNSPTDVGAATDCGILQYSTLWRDLDCDSPATLRLRTVLSAAPARFASGRTSSARPSHRRVVGG